MRPIPARPITSNGRGEPVQPPNAFEKLRKYEDAINKAQRNANDGRADVLFYANDIDEVKQIASDSKMEIFRLWYLVHTGKEYEL